jgi:hypothetical protein
MSGSRPGQVRGDESMKLDKGNSVRVLMRVGRIAAFGVLAWLLALSTSRIGGRAQSTEWINLYSTNSTLEEEPLPVGAVVAVFDPQGTKCGEFEVTTEGWYGLLACYRDDPMTDEDEGATVGEPLSFTVDGEPAGVTLVRLNGTGMSRSTRVTWTALGDRWEVDLQAPLEPVGGYSVSTRPDALPGQRAAILVAAIGLVIAAAIRLLIAAATARGDRGSE